MTGELVRGSLKCKLHYFSISNQMETKVFLNLVEFKICNFTIFYKNKCTQKETKRKNFEKTFIFFRTKNTTKM